MSRVLKSFAVAAALMTFAGAASAQSYSRFTIAHLPQNQHDDREANDLHVTFTKPVQRAKVRPRAQPPGNDAFGVVTAESGNTRVEWATGTFGTVPQGSAADIDVGSEDPDIQIDPTKSFWTADGVPLGSMQIGAVRSRITMGQFFKPTVRIKNEGGVPKKILNSRVYRDAPLDFFDIDQCWNPPTPFEQLLPPNTILQPNQEVQIELPNAMPGTYILVGAMVEEMQWGTNARSFQALGVFCPADFNRDGFVNGDDFDEFVSVFEAGDDAADFNGDDFVNGDDFDEYVLYFEAGC